MNIGRCYFYAATDMATPQSTTCELSRVSACCVTILIELGNTYSRAGGSLWKTRAIIKHWERAGKEIQRSFRILLVNARVQQVLLRD